MRVPEGISRIDHIMSMSNLTDIIHLKKNFKNELKTLSMLKDEY